MGTKIALAGAILGFLGAVGIYFEPNEPYKHWIVVAGTLSGVVTAFMIAAFVRGGTTIWTALIVGGACGLLNAASVYFAKGGWQSGDAPFILPTVMIEGLILGVVVRWLMP